VARKHRIIFIPGFGGKKSTFDRIFRLWQGGGVTTEIYRFGWKNASAFFQKQRRLLDRIDELVGMGFEVSLVGISAGASVALNAFRERQDVLSVVNICGPLRMGSTGNEAVFERAALISPVFRDAIVQFDATIGCIFAESRAQVLSMSPFFDNKVPVDTIYFHGAKNVKIMSVFHGLSIAVALVFYRHKIIRFLYAQKPK